MNEKLIWGETCGISPDDPEYDAFMDRFENDAPLDQRDAKLMLAYLQFQLAAANAALDKLREIMPETLKYSSNGSRYVQAVGTAIDILYAKEAEHGSAE